MLNAALQNPNLTEAERLAQYKQSARYQAYQARMQAWQAEQERKRQAAMAVSPAPDWRAGDSVPDSAQTFIGAAYEKFVITKGVVLKGGPGSPTSYAKLAEENYTGHSYGGNAPIVDSISFLNDALVWVRDNTPLLDIMFRPEARGVIFYQPKTFEPVITLEPPQGFPKLPFSPQPGSILIPGGTGMSITSVQIENHSGEVLGIQSVWVDLHPANNNQVYASKRAYPFDYPILTSPDFNVIQPDGVFRLNIEPVDVLPGSAAKITINVQSESGRHAPIVQEVVP